MRGRPLLPLIFAVLVGCAHAGSGRPLGTYPYNDDLSILDVETNPGWVGLLYAENSDLALTRAASPDGTWTASVAAGGAVLRRGDQILVPIDAEAGAARCVVLPPSAPMAANLRAVVAPVLATGGRHEIKYAEVHRDPGVPRHVVHAMVSGGALSGTSIEILYVKAVAAAGPHGSVLCTHHRFGYRATLEEVASSFAASLRWRDGRSGGTVDGAEAEIRHRQKDLVRASRITVRGRGELVAEDRLLELDAAGQPGICTRLVDGETSVGADACADLVPAPAP